MLVPTLSGNQSFPLIWRNERPSLLQDLSFGIEKKLAYVYKWWVINSSRREEGKKEKENWSIGSSVLDPRRLQTEYNIAKLTNSRTLVVWILTNSASLVIFP